jgi:hypothetical protein
MSGELMFTRTSQAFVGSRDELNDPLLYGRLNGQTGFFDASAPKILRATFRVGPAQTIGHASVGFRRDEAPAVAAATPYEDFCEIALEDSGVIAINTNIAGAGAVGAPVNGVTWTADEDIELMAMLGVPRLSENAAFVPRFFVNGTEVFATNLPYNGGLGFQDGEGAPAAAGPVLGFIQCFGGDADIIQTRYIEFGDAGILNDPH